MKMSVSKRIKEKIRFILRCHYRFARVMSCLDYAKSKSEGGEYHLIESNRRSIVSPVQFIGEEQVNPLEIAMPDTYWMRIENGAIIGGSSVVVSSDDVLLYDMLANRKQYNANITDNGLMLLGGRPRHVGNKFVYNYFREIIEVLPSAISLACNMSHNYYHFMLQVASRFYLLSKIQICKDIPLVVDEIVMSVPQMKEVIDALNVEHRNIITITKNQMFRVRDLYIISEPNVIVPNSFSKEKRKTEDFAFDKQSIEYVKNTIINGISISLTTYPKRVFLSRKGCAKRRCNEDELMIMLRKLGFESIQTDNMSISEQISLFSNAECIIGSSGAAFTNLIYSNKGTNAILFFTGRHNVTCYSSLGAVLGINTSVIYPEHEDSEVHTEYYCINANAVYDYLNKMLKYE